jgi:hypothetical protein
MPATESGTYRVLPGQPDGEGLVLLERWSEDPVSVRTDGYEEPLAAAVAELDPGNLVEASLAWPPEGPPAVTELSVATRTLFAFVDGADHVFEKASETFESGRRERAAIASTTTFTTDGEPNGALYTIAKQGGGTDIFAQFRDGRRTLEPMVEKLGEGGAEPPHEVFVIRPVEEPFVVVYLAIDRDGLLAETVRDEFDCPRDSC